MSESIVPKRPTNTTNINATAHEAQRLAFLNRFIASPCLMSVVLCIRDYIQSSMVADTYQYQWVTQQFKKNGTVHGFSDAELYLLIANYEANSFCSQVVNIIVDDLQYNIDAQQAIEDTATSTIATQNKIVTDPSSTQTEIDAANVIIETETTVLTNARTARFKFKAMKDALDTYKKDFLNWTVLTGEIMSLLKVLLAVNE